MDEELRYLEVGISLLRRLKEGKLKPSSVRRRLLRDWITSIEKRINEKDYLFSTREERDEKYQAWYNGLERFKQEWGDFLDKNPLKEEYEALYEMYKTELVNIAKKQQLKYKNDFNEELESGLNMAILEAVEKFDIPKGGKFEGVLYYQTKNQRGLFYRAKDLERKHRKNIGELARIKEDSYNPPNAEQQEFKRFYINAIDKALLNLPKQDRTILTMKYFFSESVQDIANKYNLTRAGVYSRLGRAKKRLKTSLIELLGIEKDKEYMSQDVVELILNF